MNEYHRKQLYIYIDNTASHDNILHSYKETADSIANGDNCVYTTQVSFIDAKWLRAGYDINIIDKDQMYKFDESYINEYSIYPPYYMLHLFTIGELY